MPDFAETSRSLCWLSPSLASLRHCRWNGLAERALGSSLLWQREAGVSRNSIFSMNLVEKLQRLGLDKVVARGEASYTTSHAQEAPPEEEMPVVTLQ